MRKELNDPLEIAALLREAIFQNTRCTLDGAYAAQIMAISEADRRSRTIERYLHLNALATFAQGQHVICSLYFSEFKVKFTTTIIRSDEESHLATFPNVMQIRNLRTSERISAKHLGDVIVPALLVEASHANIVSLKLVDIGSGGFSASVLVPPNIEPKVGNLLIAHRNTINGRIKMEGEVVFTTLERRDPGIHHWMIKATNSSKFTNEGLHQFPTERRSEARLQHEGFLSLTPAIDPYQSIEIKLRDITLSGFLADLPRSTHRRYIYNDATFKAADSDLIARVVHCDSKVFRCQWIAGSESARRQWLDFVSPAFQRDISNSLPEASSVMRIFCESGALGSEYLHAHRSIAELFSQAIENESKRKEYVHRWIDLSKAGKARGHVGAYKISDCAWVISDIAGGITEDTKINKAVVRQFMRSFGSFCMACRPCPYIFIFWTQGHRYWERWEKWFNTQERTVIARARIAYSRTVAPALKIDTSIRAREVQASHYHEIEDLKGRIASTLQPFIEMFDFSCASFGSPGLSGITRKSGEHFDRKYFVLGAEADQVLCVMTYYPLGQSINRTIESAWVFPLVSEDELRGIWPTLVDRIRTIGVELGVAVPSVRRFVNEDSKLDGELDIMTCYLLHPRGVIGFGSNG